MNRQWLLLSCASPATNGSVFVPSVVVSLTTSSPVKGGGNAKGHLRQSHPGVGSIADVVCNVLLVGYVLLNQVLVINDKMPLMSLLYQINTTASTKARRIVQVQSWHKHESMLMLEDEERQLAGVDSPFYTAVSRASGRDFRSVEPG